MGKPSAPPPPDYGPLIEAQTKQADFANKLATEQFAWAKDVYASDKLVTDKVVDSFLETMDTAKATAAKDRARYETVFQPLEDQLVSEAKDYASPERKAREMGRAQAGVAQTFDAQRKASTRELESFGVNPSATRFGALDIGIRADQAAAEAGAADTAGRAVDDRAIALRDSAINIGRGYPAQSNAALSQSGTAASGVSGTVNDASRTGGALQGTAPQYMGAATDAYAGIASTMNQSYNNQIAQFNANQNASSGFGSILGLVGGIAGKAFGLDEGGAIPDPRRPPAGGVVPRMASPTAGAIPDDVPATLTPGEFVVPKSAVSWFGEKHFHDLILKEKKQRQEIPMQSGAIPTMKNIPQATRQAAALPMR